MSFVSIITLNQQLHTYTNNLVLILCNSYNLYIALIPHRGTFMSNTFYSMQCDLEKRTLLEKEKYIREQVDSLNKVKHDRLKRLKRLTEMEVALCKSLGEDSQLAETYQSQSVPSEEDLLGFRKRVEFLESVKVSKSQTKIAKEVHQCVLLKQWYVLTCFSVHAIMGFVIGNVIYTAFHV